MIEDLLDEGEIHASAPRLHANPNVFDRMIRHDP